MKFRLSNLALGATALTLALPAAAQDLMTGERASANEVRAHVEFLADDLLEGRDTGQPGYDIAARYVASRYKAMGLEPGGDDGSYFQTVPFVRATPVASSMAMDGAAIDETGFALFANSGAEQVTLEAPVIFVGRGLDEPLLGFDDYAGLDVAGKIVIADRGLPEGQPSDIAAHLGGAKLQAAADNGAVGYLEIAEGERGSRIMNFLGRRPGVDWIGTDGKPGGLRGDLQFRGMISADTADMLRDAGGDARLSVALTSSHEKFDSANVIARLPGGDPALADEHVFMTAHLDHVGVNERAPGEDKIFNGALDNAAGVSTMLEAARLFTTMDERPDRSITFIALTGEEKGLRGAGYYAHNPTVPLEDIAAVVNLDMPVPLYEFTDVVAFGADYNSVAESIAEAGATLDITVSPDPMPEQGIFTRSDHYRFAQKGIPAVLLFTGYAGEGEQVFGEFFANHYHQPSDDLSLPIQWDQLAKYADLNYRIALTIAEDEQRPLWYADNYFADRFAPGGERAERPRTLDSASGSN